MPPNAIFAPEVSFARVGAATTISLVGVNMIAGDDAFWVPEGAADGCENKNRTQLASVLPASTLQQPAAMLLTSVFDRPGIFYLCYRWSHTRYAPAEPQPQIRAAAAQIDTPLPFGTAMGCKSTITVGGVGFDLFNLSFPTDLYCSWGAGYTYPPLISRNDLEVACQTPAPQTLDEESLPFALLVVPAGQPPRSALAEVFVYELKVFDLSIVRLDGSFPVGAPYNYELAVEISGSGLESYGTPRCKFNGIVGAIGAANIEGSRVNCSKPPLPDEHRMLTGAVPIEYSPNGQVSRFHLSTH